MADYTIITILLRIQNKQIWRLGDARQLAD